MNEDTERCDFEIWIRLTLGDDDGWVERRASNGTYRVSHVDMAWHAWKMRAIKESLWSLSDFDWRARTEAAGK